MASLGNPIEALAVLVQDDTYMRPGELCSLAPSQLVEPVAGISPKFGILLHPREGGEGSKTNEFDESLLLDTPGMEWLGQQLLVIKAGRHGQTSLFPFTHAEYYDKFMMAVRQLKLQDHHLVPHSLRHSGASRDLLLDRRPLAAVKARGRWRSDQSLKRYGKAARSLSEAATYPRALLDYGQRVKDSLQAYFEEGRSLPPIPVGISNS